jgi:hypothetical protein
MIVAGIYSHSGGQEIMESQYPNELAEIYGAIEAVDAQKHKNKVSKEQGHEGELFYSPVGLNDDFKDRLYPLGWQPVKVYCDYPTQYYAPGYTPPPKSQKGPGPYREMDFVKNKVGIEVQLGKYAFMVYNVSAKMTIFHNLGYIDVGIEIVPIKELADEMSSGVSYFEQLVWDLMKRGAANIDLPVLVLGIAKRPDPVEGAQRIVKKVFKETQLPLSMGNHAGDEGLQDS